MDESRHYGGRPSITTMLLMLGYCSTRLPSYRLLLSLQLLVSARSLIMSSSASSSASSSRGAFIVLEGVDRCGKTTQVARLVDRLLLESKTSVAVATDTATTVSSDDNSNQPPAVVAMRFPDRTTPIGRIINEYLASTTTPLDDCAIHLLFSANRWEASTSIQRQLQQGTTIVCDRYVHSGVAFSAAKVVEDVDDTVVEELEHEDASASQDDDNNNKKNADGTTPLLSLEWCQAPDKGLPAPDCVIFLDMSPEQAEERGGYGDERYERRDLQLRVRQRFHELRDADTRIPWYTVSAAQPIEAVEAEIYTAVQATLETVRQDNKPLKKMWQDGHY